MKIGSSAVLSLFFILFSIGMTDMTGFDEIYNCEEAGFLVIFIILTIGEANMIYDNLITHNVFYRVYSSYVQASKPYLPLILGEKM